jgi:L-rhamnose isomerase/sugar isomerase
MSLNFDHLHTHNEKHLARHQERFDALSNGLIINGFNVDHIVDKLAKFQVAIPTWALGAGGTRFGRFSFSGEPASLEQKIEDIGIIHGLTQTAEAISLHIPWDIPSDYKAIKELATVNNLLFDSVNSNTFQDQKNQKLSYKYGSLSNLNFEVREQAIQHNFDVINIGNALGSKSLIVWLSDGSSFPGQNNFQTAFNHAQESLIQIYQYLPDDWKLFI